MLSKFSVKKPYTVLVAVALIIILGVVSFMKMTTDLLPNISLPYVIVMTTYPGASPETVEMVVTKPVEASMATVSNIEGVSSVSAENYSLVILEFAQSTDMDTVFLEVRESLDQIRSYWDDSVGSPIIMRMNPDMLPIMISAVGVENMTMAEITDLVENNVIPDLESIEGVASVSATGLMKESVHVIIRQEKIDSINQQVFGYIDESMEEAQQDIEDAKKELEEAKKELTDGKSEIAEGKDEIAKAEQELNDAETELKDGKAELESSKADLEAGKRELEIQKESMSEKLAAAEKQLLTAKADLEAAKIVLTMDITTAEVAGKGLKEAQAGLDKLEEAKVQLETLISTLGALPVSTYGDAIAAIGSADPDMASLVSQGIADTIGTPADDAALGDVISDLQAYIDQTLSPNITAVKETIAALNAQTMGMSADQYIGTLKGQLSEIEDNIIKVDEGLVELYKGNLTAAIEFAGAQSKIDLGEMQMKTAETQMEAGEEQIEAGREQIISSLEQLEDALEQIKDGEEQLRDGEEQIKDGEEQLKEAWDEAYINADMQGILTVDTVKGLLTAQNFSMPGGYVTEEGISYLVRVGDKPATVEEMASMPILNMNMDGVDVITLGDVADVFMTDNSDEIYAKVNGSPGIMLTMQKQTGYATGDVSERILDRFEELTQEYDNLTVITLMDQGVYIDLVVDSIFSNILVGGILAMVILIIFLRDIRPTFVIACSIPISLVTTIVCMYFSGVTLNIISLSGLALGIGMLVDNSIVVIENIYRLRGEGYSMREAAIEGSKEVGGAIIASTLTTVCVFAPIVFTEGITRQLFVDMGLTIAYSLLASLIMALTVVPAVSSKALTKTVDKKDGKIFGAFINGYEKLLRICIKWKPVVFIVVIILFIVSMVASFSKGTAFMTDMDSPQMTITVTMPDYTPLDETGEVTDEVVERIRTIPEVEDVGAMAGETSLLSMGGSSATNQTTVYVTMSEDKKRTNEELAVVIYDMLTDIEEAQIDIETSSMDMSALGGSGITIQVRGRELDTLQEIAKEAASILEGVEGTTDVSDGLEDAKGELRIIIDRNKAIEYELTVAQVFQQIQAKLASASSSTKLETEIREFDVYVKHAGNMELTRQDLKSMEIDVTRNDGKKEKVLLSEIADFISTTSPESINREDQTRYISVSAAIVDGYNVGLVSADMEEAFKDYELPAGYSLRFVGENEMINDAMEQIMLMLLLAVLFMYLIMVAQFQSLLSPFIIMFTIPLAFTGGFLGLYFTNSEVSVIALIGFVMLSGIIVNNGIVLVDYINQLRASGMGKKEAIIEAGRTRMRPVLMTALTTILAMVPMVLSKDMGADMAKPMAIVTIGGLTYGTLLTLIVIPCIYDVFMRVKKDKQEKMLEAAIEKTDETREIGKIDETEKRDGIRETEKTDKIREAEEVSEPKGETL